jgi:hypothetical protein
MDSEQTLTLEVSRKTERSERPMINVFVGTWNLGNCEPDSLAGWIPTFGFDLYFIGVQESRFQARKHREDDDSVRFEILKENEIVDQAEEDDSGEDEYRDRFRSDRKFDLSSTHSRASGRGATQNYQTEHEDPPDHPDPAPALSPWLHMLKRHFGSGFTCIKSQLLGQIEGALFCPNEHARNVGQVLAAAKAVGVLGVGTNKGGVGISCTFRGARLVFITAHLPAHQRRVSQRNEAVSSIIAALSTGLEQAEPEFGLDLLNKHHVTFFCGDLNYRCGLGDPGDSVSPELLGSYTDLIRNKDFAPLLKSDQLLMARARGEAFAWFQEAPITFRPTFKLARSPRVPPHSTPSPKTDRRTLDVVKVSVLLPVFIRGFVYFYYYHY